MPSILVSLITLFLRKAIHLLDASLALREVEVIGMAFELPLSVHSPQLLHGVLIVSAESASGLFTLLGELGEVTLFVLEAPRTTFLGVTELVLFGMVIMLFRTEDALAITLVVFPSIHSITLALHTMIVERAGSVESFAVPLVHVTLQVSKSRTTFVRPTEFGTETIGFAEAIARVFSEIAIVFSDGTIDWLVAAFVLTRQMTLHNAVDVPIDVFVRLMEEVGMFVVFMVLLKEIVLHAFKVLGAAISIMRTMGMVTAAAGMREIVVDLTLLMPELSEAIFAVSRWVVMMMMTMRAVSVERLNILTIRETRRDRDGS
ncbi:hypothetical protein FRB96_008848 [Tulasnella sp. 330]|nr:hypothetical protein FRB96_008848 [Tulasnella sp. 330]KAG8871895.1 hypothetical protein FRB97_008223 [Tulasnella sp. 331]